MKYSQFKLLRMTAIEWLVTVGIIALLISIVLPSLQRMREARTGRNPCSSRLSQIGSIMLLYSMDHGGRCPDDFAELLNTQDITQEVFICPSDSESHPLGQSTYVYLGKGKIFSSLGFNDVLAYEPLSVHETGGNVLFGDGHVMFVSAADYGDVKKGWFRPGNLPPVSQPTSIPASSPSNAR